MSTEKSKVDRKRGESASAQAQNDFYKSNGVPHVWMPEGPSMTRQEFAAECDINTLMDRYQNTGMLPPVVGDPVYVDFTSIPSDLMGTMELFDKAQAAFMTLPAKVRREFENDPHAFVDFATNPANLEQMREWDLAPPLVDPKAVFPVAEVAAGAAQAAPAGPPSSPPKAAPAASTQSSS